MKIYHDIVFNSESDDGDKTALISDAYKGDFELANEAGDNEFALMYSVKGKKQWYDEEEGGLISDKSYEDKEDKSMCESTYDIVHQYNLEDFNISTVKFKKYLTAYTKKLLKVLPKGQTKKTLKGGYKKCVSLTEDGSFYKFVKENKDNISFLVRQGTQEAAENGSAMIMVADMTDWKEPTYYWFGAGLQGESV